MEVTLLGQNVNTYGVEFGDRLAFGKLLRACGEIEGLERVRFTSPHPAAFTDDVIAAMAETPNVMPSLHMPLQAGSDRVLKAMRRSYRSARFLGILDKVRAQIPDAAITTDLIVGFPGETEEDFAADAGGRARLPLRQRLHLPVLHPPRHAGGHHGRPGAQGRGPGPLRAAARRAGGGVLGRRTAGWRAAPSRCWSPRARAARTPPPHRLSGRARDNRLVHFAVPEGAAVPRPGDVVEVAVTYGAPHHLVADSGLAGRGLRGAPHPRRRRVGGPAGRAAAGSPRSHASACRRSGGRPPCPRRRSPAADAACWPPPPSCPAPPAFVPQLMGRAAHELDGIRTAADTALTALTDELRAAEDATGIRRAGRRRRPRRAGGVRPPARPRRTAAS